MQAASSPAAPVEIPALYEEDRWYVAPVTAQGETLIFFTDSGGGMNMVLEPVAGRLGLPQEEVELDGQKMKFAAWPELSASASIPLPSPEAPGGGRLAVVPLRGELLQMFRPTESGQPREAGFLGRWWFADRVWTFDYPGRKLLLRAAGDLPPHAPEHRVPLGFQTGPDGKRTTHFPRIQARIDGETLDLLFDTGATSRLTRDALAALGDGRGADRGSSFIAASVFDRWVERHPDWRVLENGEEGTGASMIEVPEVEVGGFKVGPVWFARRLDRNFHEWMSQWMDKRIDGALGGSAFRYLRVTIDYTNAVAVFEKP